MIHNIPQPKFEQFIADQLQNDPNVILRKNVAFIKCGQTPKDITCIVEERSTKVRWQIKSRHLLACDGARSEVRKDLAIESEGDAAHSFPPTGGLGLNSGIADAHNIAYKLAAVHYGWARSSILDSFEGDRRQVALVNSAQSVKNGKQIFSFLKSLGTAGVQDEQEARENLHRSVHDPRIRAKIAEEVEAQREHFDNVCLPSVRILLTHFLPSNGLT
ncbi:hypothetical protein K4K59_000598 [Colletotrichum sp. SAR11_240]|nr:hypothetical protein K4K59_000598 [Colletotrichum sp. SAR11_240]